MFALKLDDKTVSIHFASSQKTDEEIEELLFDFNNRLKLILEMQNINMKDRDIENNCLLLTTETKLDAKQLNKLFIKHCGLEMPNAANMFQ